MNRPTQLPGRIALLFFTVLCMAGSVRAELQAGKLLIWTSSPQTLAGLQRLSNEFTTRTGMPVTVEHPRHTPEAFQEAALAGRGPDILINAHDRIGEWVELDLLAPVSPSDTLRQAAPEFSWEAVTYRGATYGYPIAVEAVGLIYNTRLIQTPPKTFEDMAARQERLRPEGVQAIVWDYQNPYFSWPLLSANGGYPFRRTADGHDPGETGVHHEGAILGASFLLDLIHQGILPEGADYSTMQEGFLAGKVAMMINGPWAWQTLREHGIPYAVAPLPTLRGQPARPFVGVTAALVNRSTRNMGLATEFIENFLWTPDGLDLINANGALGAPARSGESGWKTEDRDQVTTYHAAESGIIIPNIPSMNRFWPAMGTALRKITTGQEPPESALEVAAHRIVR